jgi:hypothetical protein
LMHLESPPYQYVEVLLNWEWLSLRRILGFGRRAVGREVVNETKQPPMQSARRL